MQAEQRIHWLIDRDLPQIEGKRPDTLPVTRLSRDVMTEALREERWVVTGNRNLLDARTIPFNCPPIVVVGGGLCTEEGLQRNLLHLEFCLLHKRETMSWEGQRFLIDLDRAIYKMNTRGGLEELETWKVPSLRGVLAWGASA